MTTQDKLAAALRTAVMQAIGEASMQWNPRPEGVFDSSGAAKIGERLLALIDYTLHDAQPKQKVGYMDGIDWQHHVEHDAHGVSVYPSPDTVCVHGPECGVVRVLITEDRWVTEPPTPVPPQAWTRSEDGRRLYADERDIRLDVDGNWTSDAERATFANWLCDALNCTNPSPQAALAQSKATP